MDILVYYQSGKLDVFSTTDFIANEPWGRTGRNLMTEFSPRLDVLEEEGFALDVFWYDGSDCKDSLEVVDEDSNTRISHAVRRVGKRILLVSKSELEQIAQITVNGELVAWRQGGFLINGTKFRNQEILCFSNDNVTGINRRASAVFDYLKKANPGVSEEALAARMGYPLEAIMQIREAEAANVADSDEDDDEDWE
ncbi:hypothetical protein CE91St62_23920 [Lachnospiraceae bacterium]|uniref:hypothetical protein n=1 Tax=Extibacter sp. GGCC_0201 TaxID=2731209 RepID=UPI001AA0F6E5|nr:hypothetical protein [Extibacter sp. GGCC_0201]MBO1721257.1 hypothetical protein [Extibacter sp. GGCC_0201]BDF34327.1 hypothetical protein CE91St61_24020 [Lachnospiraceae bacterium]BDF38331.1 hypothetical protein CE91St62_23920 [Lachnospiraceae bacterium]